MRTPRPRGLGIVATTAATVLVTTMLVGSPANASPGVEIDTKTATALRAAVDTRTNVFDGQRARGAGVGAAAVEEFATGWSVAGGRVQNAPIDQALVDAVQESAPASRACAGRNRWDYTGIQLNVYLNSCNTTRLIGALAAGAGGATLLGIITAATGLGGAAAGAIAAALAIAGGILTACSARGRGVVVHNIPPGPVAWCNGQ